MVEVMKNQDKRASVLFGYTSAKEVTWLRHFIERLAEELHLTFVLPFIQSYSLTQMEFPIYINFKNPQLGFQAQFVHDEQESTWVCS